MAGAKYLTNQAGFEQEVRASQASVGAADAGKIVALDAAGKINSSMLPSMANGTPYYIAPGNTFSIGAFVQVVLGMSLKNDGHIINNGMIVIK